MEGAMATAGQEKPTVLFVGEDEESVRRASSDINGADGSPGFGVDVVTDVENFSIGEEGNADCFVVVTDDIHNDPLLEKVRTADTQAPFVLFSQDSSATPEEVVEAGFTDYVELSLGDRAEFVRRRLKAYAEANDLRESRKDSFPDGSETVFDSVQDPMFLLDVRPSEDDVSFVVERINPAYEEKVGVSREEFEGRKSAELFGEEVGRELRDNYLECYTRKEELRYEEELEVPRGTRVYQTRLSPVVVEGEVEKIVGNARDITERKERERKLREKRTQLQALLDTVSAAIFMKNTEGEYLFVNQRCREVLGVGKNENIEGMTDYDLFTDEVAEDFLADDRRVFEEEETVEVKEEVPTEEGTRTHLTLKSPVYDDEGQLYGFCAVSTDISEREERERELRRRSEAMEASMDGMAILDDDGEYVYVNQAHVDVYGYDDEEDFLGNTWHFLYDDEVERLEDEVMSTLFEEGEWRGEATGLRADGTEFPQDLSLTFLEDGNIICVVRDITERKEREKELERYEAFVENSSDMITLLAEDGTILYQSSSVTEMLGYGQDETVGDLSFDYVHPDDRAHVAEMFSSLVNQESKRKEDVEFRFRHADDSYVWLEAVGVDKTDTDVGGVVVNSRDMTERRKRERKLEEQKEQIEFFNSLLRHDLLNSMTVITGNANLLLEEIDEDDERRKYAEKILEKSKDIEGLTKRVRSVLSRLTEEAPTELSSYDISQVLEDRLESLVEAYPDAEYTADLPQTAPVVADDFLEDVIDNVLINAVEHNRSEEPRVEVEAETGPDTTTVHVADNGSGIPDDKKESVLSKGERGSGSSGLGFGLYFVNSMVSEYGGNVSVRDNEPRGAVVSIELPKPDREEGDNSE